MNIRPLYDNILVKRTEAATMTVSGLHLPGGGETPDQGTVIAVGPDVEGIVESDVVLLGKYAGTEVKVNGAEHLVVKAENVLGVIED